MNHDSYPDLYILRLLDSVRTLAMVGASDLWNRPSFFAMKYLQEKGYRVIPVNPRLAATGATVLGERVYASLAETPGPFEMVDFYLRPAAVGAVVDQAIAVAPEKGIRVIWMQLGIRDDAAAERAERAGLDVVMDRCPKIEWGRLHAELSWGGFNSRVITAKRRRVPAR
ncbi:MAG TPA: CoA-binding protein [Thermoanaerobaculia bacterium]|nr:CoA-binding protein [Thermoanaerobaculia bacterium]